MAETLDVRGGDSQWNKFSRVWLWPERVNWDPHQDARRLLGRNLMSDVIFVRALSPTHLDQVNLWDSGFSGGITPFPGLL